MLNKDLITSLLNEARSQVQAFLPQELSNDQAKNVIARYTATIEGNFIAWMGAAVITTRSVQARYASSENLWVEMRDNHAGLLHDFAKSAKALPGQDSIGRTEPALAQVRALVTQMSGFKNLALMAYLENTSADFIPLLEKLAMQLGSRNLLYTKIHGVADILHADQFSWALTFEAEHYPDPQKDIEETFMVAENLLRAIFAPSPE